MKKLNKKELELINGGETGDAAEVIGFITGFQWLVVCSQCFRAKKTRDYFLQ